MESMLTGMKKKSIGVFKKMILVVYKKFGGGYGLSIEHMTKKPTNHLHPPCAAAVCRPLLPFSNRLLKCFPYFGSFCKKELQIRQLEPEKI
jgi:hypothetical protein